MSHQIHSYRVISRLHYPFWSSMTHLEAKRMFNVQNIRDSPDKDGPKKLYKRDGI
jgi:hypothetical protein